ncbi:uncharacterized protein A4U43_C04F2100 [Asparagus officinalis]|uniref:Uncharacterized protein n=1 Tax=Asparagus officinalis TaxID=4686 RepID=A0A5P1EZE0_ASPOF|nr:uncharacterized protein A4U43_C04F2100 [Asparagus officinalis]
MPEKNKKFMKAITEQQRLTEKHFNIPELFGNLSEIEMTQHWDVDAKFTDESTSSASSDPQPSFHPNLRPRNVFRLLALREISPRSKNSSKRFWNQTSKVRIDEYRPIYEIIDARHALLSWVEADSLGNLTAKYCSLLPPPRSTIAAAFSTDGKRLASTHGDHTVKIMDCQTGSCLKVLSGHRRTPWVVRFHPLHSEVLASGSLDHEVRLWNANTAACIGSHDFYRPIASIAFHAQGEVIAVASGHRLFMWHYNNRRGESASPTSVLKTRRSLRAVQFHPFGAPLLLTAEVNDLESPDHQLTLATTPGYPHYPPAIIYRNMKQSTNTYDETRLSFTPSPYISEPTFLRDSRQRLQQYDMPTGSVNWHQRAEFSQQQAYSNTGSHHHSLAMPMEVCFDPYGSYLPAENLPLLYGVDVATGYSGSGNTENINWQHTVRSQLSPSARVNERMDAAHNDEPSIYQGTATAAERSNGLHGRSVRSTTAINLSNFTGNREFSTPMMSDYGSEMGAHFSPCGRFLAACVACVLPQLEGDHGLQSQMNPDALGAATSPTQHPLSAHQVIYELRIYSLEEATFGSILASRAIRAAHCLTSIQFAPTSEHLLLAYGRRHGSLRWRNAINEETATGTYTIMEIYRVSDMELVRVLPSADDEEGKLRIFQYDGPRGTDFTGTNSLFEENMMAVEYNSTLCVIDFAVVALWCGNMMMVREQCLTSTRQG